DAYERTLPEVFPGSAPGNFTQVPGLGWVWTTFHDYQWDLNYANPAVFRAMLKTMFRLANRGVDVLRLDAAPFLWKRAGTGCQNQAEAHWLVQAFRALSRLAMPGLILKAEAIVSPDMLAPARALHHGRIHHLLAPDPAGALVFHVAVRQLNPPQPPGAVEHR